MRDMNDIMNEFLLSILNEHNVAIVKEIRMRWRQHQGEVVVSPSDVLQAWHNGKYTEEQMDKAIEDAFKSARLVKPLPFEHQVYPTFQDYIKSLQ